MTAFVEIASEGEVAKRVSDLETGGRIVLVGRRSSSPGLRVSSGGVAQLGERGVRNAEVRGSNPLTSTTR